MTECTPPALSFSSLGGKTVVADFLGGRLTSDAGALLLREVDRHLGLIDALNGVIPDPRQPELIQHEQRALLAQRIIAIALGYEDLNDHATLCHDPALQLAAAVTPSAEARLGSPATLCRLENRIDRKTLVRMAGVLVDQFIASHVQAPDHLILDFEATDDPVHGHQEHRFFHGHYDHYCFLPLYVFCNGHLLVPYLRPSNIDGCRHTRAIVKLLVSRLRATGPDVKIIIRADSGFCRWRLMRWCDHHGVGYVLGLAQNKALLREASPYLHEAAHRCTRTGQPQRIFGSFSYAAGSWDRSRRVIVKAEHTTRGANPRFLVVNVPGDPPWLYEEIYCQRGEEAENRIKEQQLGLFADRTSCHDFLANQFRLMLSSAAYVLVHALRRLALEGTELAKATVGTIRSKLLKIAARVQVSVRRVVFHLATSYPFAELFRHALARVMGQSEPAPTGG
jgi:hypothetical protein